MAEKDKLVPVVGGLAISSLGLWLLLRKKKPPLPEPPENGVVVGLINPPSDATMWTLILTDWDITIPIDPINEPLVPARYIDIAEAAIFEIPSGVKFPLRVATLQLVKWNEDETALIQLYYAQSMHPTLWDWNIGDWGDEPDPTYREAFIPDYGSYYYNVAAERFE